jgi:hypothetical protein
MPTPCQPHANPMRPHSSGVSAGPPAWDEQWVRRRGGGSSWQMGEALLPYGHGHGCACVGAAMTATREIHPAHIGLRPSCTRPAPSNRPWYRPCPCQTPGTTNTSTSAASRASACRSPNTKYQTSSFSLVALRGLAPTCRLRLRLRSPEAGSQWRVCVLYWRIHPLPDAGLCWLWQMAMHETPAAVGGLLSGKTAQAEALMADGWYPVLDPTKSKRIQRNTANGIAPNGFAFALLPTKCNATWDCDRSRKRKGFDSDRSTAISLCPAGYFFIWYCRCGQGEIREGRRTRRCPSPYGTT